MRFALSRPVAVVCAALLLSACGHGGGGSALPTVSDASSPRSPSSVAGEPTGTLYVSGAKGVYTYDLAANGPSAPVRTLTPHVNQQVRNVAIATAADGNLGVLQEFFPDAGGHHCRLVVLSPTANGTTGTLANIDCGNYATDASAYGVARNGALPSSGNVAPGGAFDVLFTQDTSSTGYVQRFDEQGRVLSILTLPGGTNRAIASDAAGQDYVDDTAGHAAVYPSTAANGGSTASSTTFTTTTGVSGPMAVNPVDNTLWIVTTNNSGQQIVEALPPSGGSYNPASPSKTIGPFGANNVTALAFNNLGKLYVGLSAISGGGETLRNAVRVYAVMNAPAMVRSIPNPVPGNYDITGLAVAQAPFGAAPGPAPSGQVGPITFASYSLGAVRGQNGWQSNSCGNSDYNANVVDTSSYPSAQWPGTPPSRVLQVDNSVTQGCYSGLGTPVGLQNAGVPSALSDPTLPIHCGITCQPFFSTQFVVTSATGAFQPDLEMSISPVFHNDGARMQYLGLWHTQDALGASKLLIFTNDVEDVVGAVPPCLQCADFVAWELAYVDPSLPHTIGMTIDFVAPDKDVTKFYVDGTLAGVQQQQFRSWEDYYLYDTESDPGYTQPYSRAVNDLLFHPGNVDSCANFADYQNNCNQRTGGPGHTSTANNGFLFTNIATCAGTSTSCASAIATRSAARLTDGAFRTLRAVHGHARLRSALR